MKGTVSLLDAQTGSKVEHDSIFKRKAKKAKQEARGSDNCGPHGRPALPQTR